MERSIKGSAGRAGQGADDVPIMYLRNLQIMSADLGKATLPD